MKNVSVEQAIAAVRAGALFPESKIVSLSRAAGRVLWTPVVASRDQPPFRASAMDGYALRRESLEAKAPLTVIGESIAGRRFEGAVALGEAVRIFTGAPVPEDCDAVIIQEKVKAADGVITVIDAKVTQSHIREAGQDFCAGEPLVEAGVRLDPWRLSLVAAAGLAEVTVARRPRVCVLCTGDELVLPGEMPRPDQIYESASHAIIALIRQWGGKAEYLGVKSDDAQAIFKAVRAADCDLIVTIGGASVGDYDLVRPALEKLGLTPAFSSVAVRPGKPSSFGLLADGRRVLGLPGNPASAFVVAQLLLKTWIMASLGLRLANPLVKAISIGDIAANGPRESYLRAKLFTSPTGQVQAQAFADQDSSLVSVFAMADALVRVAPNADAVMAGQLIDILPLDRSI